MTFDPLSAPPRDRIFFPWPLRPREETTQMSTTGQGSAGNVIAALCSLIFPGLGQLIQGRVIWAIVWFLLACVFGLLTIVLTLGFAPFGWALVSVLACIHAAVYKP
jgi:TM2 domain-containing membrane protein YozV